MTINNMMIRTGGPLNLFEFNNLGKIPGLVHFVTTRSGGVSTSAYKSLNLGLHTADNPADVHTNRTLLAGQTGIAPDMFLYASQVHSGDVTVIDEVAVRKGVLTGNPQTDAMVTGLTGICLMVMVADCVPVVLFDPVRKVSAVIHAGWRGTVQNISSKTVLVMTEHFGCRPSDVLAGIGPSIGPCCYEVGADVEKQVLENFGTISGYIVPQKNSAKPHFDLWFANQRQLTDAGIRPENIETAELCTLCNSGLFFSSRASGGITGRFAAGICMK